MRAQDGTITWLRFRAELKQAPPSFWLLLGECVANTRQLSRIPAAASDARTVERELLAQGLHARLAMDGSALTLEQVMLHLGGRLRLPASQEALQLEADDLLHTWQRGMAPGTATSRPLDLDLIRNYHAALVGSAPHGDLPGAWRQVEPGSIATDGVPCEMIPLFTEELFDWLQGPELAAPGKEDGQAYTLLHALIAELYLAWILPFGSGHARVTGTVVLHILFSGGLDASVGHLISSHFHKNRRAYQRELEMAARGTADIIPFLAFGLRGLAEGLTDTLSKIRQGQADGLWKAHLYDLFGDSDHGSAQRQRQLILDLADQEGPVPISALSRLSPTAARYYAGVSEKTLRRDVDALESLGTILRGPGGLTVRRERLLAFKGPKG